MSHYEPRCKVCNSPNRALYEKLFKETKGNIKWTALAEKAKLLGENISRRAFERHFSRHFTLEMAEVFEKEDEVQQVVEKERREVIDLVKEIKNNLEGLKTLLSTSLASIQNKPLSPAMLRVITEIYREHRQSLEACERLTSKLQMETSLSETEVLRLLYHFSKDLCPECLKKFKTNLENYLEMKKSAKHEIA